MRAHRVFRGECHFCRTIVDARNAFKHSFVPVALWFTSCSFSLDLHYAIHCVNWLTSLKHDEYTMNYNLHQQPQHKKHQDTDKKEMLNKDRQNKQFLIISLSACVRATRNRKLSYHENRTNWPSNCLHKRTPKTEPRIGFGVFSFCFLSPLHRRTHVIYTQNDFILDLCDLQCSILIF